MRWEGEAVRASFLTIMASAGVLSGCAAQQMEWYRPDGMGSQTQFEFDKTECGATINYAGALLPGAAGLGSTLNSVAAFKACMAQRGYLQRPQGAQTNQTAAPPPHLLSVHGWQRALH
jgi:hypothetical protein